MSGHLACFALCPALPDSLAGRDSCDYYQASVAIGLASRRRSHVRPCCTCRAELRWPTHLLECPHWASLRAPEVASANQRYQRRTRHRFRRLSGGCRLASAGDWASGNPAFTIFRGSRGTPHPYAWARPPLSWHALVPFTFRIQVSHQTQEPPSEFLPAAPEIQQGASWRTLNADVRCDTRSHVLSEYVDWRSGVDARDVAPGQCPRPVPALTCVASDCWVRSSGESPRVPIPTGCYR
jgi:hypothetical protein